jgi:hypothetical protein
VCVCVCVCRELTKRPNMSVMDMRIAQKELYAKKRNWLETWFKCIVV